MNNLFNNPGKTYNHGFFVASRLKEGQYGTLKIFRFVKFDYFQNSGNISYDVFGGRIIAAAQEPSFFGEKERAKQPCARVEVSMYLPYSWKHIEAISTTNGSRVLIMKKYEPIVDYASEERDDGESVAILCDDRVELRDYLTNVLLRMGVPKDNIEMVKAHLLTRLGIG